MLRLLATTNPLNYGSAIYGKSHASLKRVAKLGTLPLHDEHDGGVIGQVTNLIYRRVAGVGQLLGLIPDTLCDRPVGVSLQYKGTPIGSRIQILPDEDLHVALTTNPRDQMTMRDSKQPIIFRDSANESTTEIEETGHPETAGEDPTGDSNAPDKTDAGTVPQEVEPQPIEIDPDDLVSAITGNEQVLGQLVSAITGNQAFIEQILAHPTIAERLKAPATNRVVIAPKQPEKSTTPTREMVLPKQQPIRPVV